ncbi:MULTISPECIES: EamA family transporter [unclassified Neorhizobium]|uniref:EamA family transporter n=1 Tax=unclassified Neorhizobium TaxID=2629175 RepID=UPI001FF218C8|nr:MULTISPECIES: EamA family transporter [unclassified Neorhizobium]MCJ9673283.1 EamA family transporter [Neorhizobium sp. SHOUNA12B]MCJ9748675.1 EamA family transporter [Neorhizobium sp. SHOUNA12A]
MRLRDILVLVAVAFIWGFNFVVIRWGLDAFPPLLLSALRFTVCLLPICFGLERPQISWSQIILLGATLGSLVFGLLNLGIYFGLSAGLASVVMQAQVFFTVIFASLFIGEKLHARTVISIFVGFFGLALIAVGGAATVTSAGFLLTLAGALSWGVSNILIKRLPPVKTLNLIVWISVVPPVPFLITSFMFEGRERMFNALASLSFPGTMTVAYTSLVSTILAYGIWGSLLQRYSASSVSPFALLVPVFGLGSAWHFLGEQPNGTELIGASITVLALAFNSLAAVKAWRSRWLVGGARTQARNP